MTSGNTCNATCQLVLASMRKGVKLGELKDVGSYVLLQAWVTGANPDQWVFGDGDVFTDEVRRQRWLDEVRQRLATRLKSMKPGESVNHDRRMKDLGEVEKMAQILEDGFAVLGDDFQDPGGRMFNDSSTVLGSYKLAARLESFSADKKSARVTFTVADTMTRQSAMRQPTAKGYEGESNPVLKFLFDSLLEVHPAGQRPMEIRVEWSESIVVR